MLTWAAVLFGLAAVGGLTMAALKGRGATPSLWIAAGHGLLAVAALILLLVGVVRGGTGAFSIAALVLFVVAAVWGLELLRSHLRQGSFPLGGALGHGVVALVALALLLAVLVR